MTDNTPPLHIDTFLPYMRDVARCETSLRELDQMWRMIESSAKMNCPVEAQSILPTMAATRAGLGRLEKHLVSSLVSEKVANVLAAIGTQAQYVIDIVVRNLYERTADVGFLATDGELCAFVAGEHQNADAVRYRLQQYQAKYTVYDEIMLLDPAGNVLVQIDPATPLEGTTDPLLAETLNSDSYVEVFRHMDLRPAKPRALVYARAMQHPRGGRVVGALCLCFDFEREMAGIFRSHRDPEGRSIPLLLDAHNRVIASADEEWIRPGTVVPVNPDGEPRLMIHGGREYLVRTCRAQGYQGYPGPAGWQGQVMVPIDLAFSRGGGDPLSGLDAGLTSSLLSHARKFSPPLFDVITATESIRRVVWNGQVITASQGGTMQKLKTILEQIAETGARGNALFSASVRDLYGTVLASNLDDARLATRLLVDLLDRNLYERANDCRWWALTPQLRHTLANPDAAPAHWKDVGEILRYIHQLYTVYTGLFVYDRQGNIRATSLGADAAPQQGDHATSHQIGAHVLQNVARLQDDQAYFVEGFGESPLYGGRPTYVYHAAIRDPRDEQLVVGGIAIVFDAAPELAAMLYGGLGVRPDAEAYFVDRQGRVLASTHPSRPVGNRLDLPTKVLAQAPGESDACIVEHDGHYAIMGSTASSGYREFKTSDGYKDDVLAVMFTRLGEVRQGGLVLDPSQLTLEHALPPGASGGKEFATFCCGSGLYALPAASVVEALPATGLTPLRSEDGSGRIGMLVPQKANLLSHFVWVFDLAEVVGQPSRKASNQGQIVIVRQGYHTLGLRVDELHGVPEFSPSRIMPSPFAGDDGGLVKEFVGGGDAVLVQVIDLDTLLRRTLGCGEAPSQTEMLGDALA